MISESQYGVQIFSYIPSLENKIHVLNNQSPIFTGNITEVFNNFTIQLNGSLNVKLAFIDDNTNNNSQKLEDSIHYVSMLCPIRSPALVFPEFETKSHSLIYLDKANLIAGIVYCQSSKYQDTLENTSVNQDLIDSEIANLDESACAKIASLSPIKQHFELFSRC